MMIALNPFRFFEWPIKQQLWTLFLLGLAARLAVSLFLADNRTLYFEHMLIAKNLLEGKGYSWDEWGRIALQTTSLVPPLYVYWCAFFMLLSPANYFIMYAAQAIIAVFGCVPAFHIGRRLFSERVGLLFAAFYAFYPEFAFIHSRPVAESIYVVLALWMIERYLALIAEPFGSKNAIRISALVGLLGGIAVLFKEAAILVAAAIIIATMLRFRPLGHAVKRHLIPMIAVLVLVLSPWFIRNAVVQGTFVPIRTAFGINWWIANHPGSAGNDRYENGICVFTELPKRNPAYNDYMNRILPADEQDRDLVYTAEVFRFIRERPSEYLTLCAKRLLYYVWFVPAHPLAQNIVYRASWIFLLVLSIPGIIMTVRNRRMDIVFPLTFAGYFLLYIPTLVFPRYRVVLVALLLLFAAVFVDNIIARIRLKSESASGQRTVQR